MSETTHQRTTYYRRWSIAKTQRRGYEPGDMTISANWEEGKNPDQDTMVSMALASYREAQAVCDELNAQETQIAKLKEAGQQQ